MIKIGILGDIGSGKSYVAQSFGYPVFDADREVSKLYKTDKKTFNNLKKILPDYFDKFPIEKKYVLEAILDKKGNLKKIVKIIHKEIRKKMNIFLKKNSHRKIVILDIPLLLENKINNKNFILIYVQSKKSEMENHNEFTQKPKMCIWRCITPPCDDSMLPRGCKWESSKELF